jgi:hypothetical protein
MTDPTPPADTGERRAAPRVQSINLVSLAQFNESGFFSALDSGRTLDVSPLGIRLELSHPLPLRTVVEMSLALGERLIELEGRVCHLEVIDEHRCMMGIELTRLGDEARAALEAAVQDRAG